MAKQTQLTKIVMYPYLSLGRVHELSSGVIGPADAVVERLGSSFRFSQFLNDFKIRVGTDTIQASVAVSLHDPQDLEAELEFLTYGVETVGVYPPASEIFADPLRFTGLEQDGVDHIRFDKFGKDVMGPTSEQDSLAYINRLYSDASRIDAGGSDRFLDMWLDSEYHSALVSCLALIDDKLVKAALQRVSIAVSLFNEAYVRHEDDGLRIVLICTAFEALLNLSENQITVGFRQSISTLLGTGSTLLIKWCESFYAYRSKLVHGEVKLTDAAPGFNTTGARRMSHSEIAKAVFRVCLGRKLTLMGLLSGQTITPFTFESLFEASLFPQPKRVEYRGQ